MIKVFEGDLLSKALEITEPFLMIDSFRLLEDSAIGYGSKNLTAEEWFFDCHLRSQMVMPATLQIEGMLQTMVMLIYQTVDHGKARSFITNIDVKVLNSAKPGTDIGYEAKILSTKRGIFKGEVIGKSNELVICKGVFSYASPHLMSVPKTV